MEGVGVWGRQGWGQTGELLQVAWAPGGQSRQPSQVPEDLLTPQGRAWQKIHDQAELWGGLKDAGAIFKGQFLWPVLNTLHHMWGFSLACCTYLGSICFLL